MDLLALGLEQPWPDTIIAHSSHIHRMVHMDPRQLERLAVPGLEIVVLEVENTVVGRRSDHHNRSVVHVHDLLHLHHLHSFVAKNNVSR